MLEIFIFLFFNQSGYKLVNFTHLFKDLFLDSLFFFFLCFLKFYSLIVFFISFIILWLDLIYSSSTLIYAFLHSL